MAKFTLTLSRVEYQRATVIVEVRTESEAWLAGLERASEIGPEWETVNAHESVESVMKS